MEQNGMWNKILNCHFLHLSYLHKIFNLPTQLSNILSHFSAHFLHTIKSTQYTISQYDIRSRKILKRNILLFTYIAILCSWCKIHGNFSCIKWKVSFLLSFFSFFFYSLQYLPKNAIQTLWNMYVWKKYIFVWEKCL